MKIIRNMDQAIVKFLMSARVSRSIALALCLMAVIPSVACNRAQKEEEERQAAKYAEEEAEAAASRRPLEVDESVVAEFSTDGAWHPLPYSVHEGQVIRIETFGDTRNYGENLIEFRLAGRVMLVTDENPFIVSNSSAITVRVKAHPELSLGPSAQIQITRLK